MPARRSFSPHDFCTNRSAQVCLRLERSDLDLFLHNFESLAFSRRRPQCIIAHTAFFASCCRNKTKHVAFPAKSSRFQVFNGPQSDCKNCVKLAAESRHIVGIAAGGAEIPRNNSFKFIYYIHLSALDMCIAHTFVHHFRRAVEPQILRTKKIIKYRYTVPWCTCFYINRRSHLSLMQAALVLYATNLTVASVQSRNLAHPIELKKRVLGGRKQALYHAPL